MERSEELLVQARGDVSRTGGEEHRRNGHPRSGEPVCDAVRQNHHGLQRIDAAEPRLVAEVAATQVERQWQFAGQSPRELDELAGDPPGGVLQVCAVGLRHVHAHQGARTLQAEHHVAAQRLVDGVDLLQRHLGAGLLEGSLQTRVLQEGELHEVHRRHREAGEYWALPVLAIHLDQHLGGLAHLGRDVQNPCGDVQGCAVVLDFREAGVALEVAAADAHTPQAEQPAQDLEQPLRSLGLALLVPELVVAEPLVDQRDGGATIDRVAAGAGQGGDERIGHGCDLSLVGSPRSEEQALF